MSGFDFAVTVSIGPILASITATRDQPLAPDVMALVLLFVLQIAVAIERVHSSRFESHANNRPRLIMTNGQTLRDPMAKARITQKDLPGKLRKANVLDFSPVDAAVAETTGDISVLHRHPGDTRRSARLLESVIDAEQYRPQPVRAQAGCPFAQNGSRLPESILRRRRRMAAYTQILETQRDGVLTLTLNRPERLNAWTPVMQAELETAIGAAGNNPDVRCIIITGAGRGFCAGADMNHLQDIQDDTTGAAQSATASAMRPATSSLEKIYDGRFGYLYTCPKPIIAAINGPCAGIGLIFALFADLRFATDDAKFTTAFAQRGLVAEHGISWVLPRLVGEANALDLLFTARVFKGDEAADLGLVNRSLPASELMAHVQERAAFLATQVSPRSVAVMKRQVRASYFQSYTESLAEADAEMAASFTTFDFKEGVESFMERRAPAFRGK